MPIRSRTTAVVPRIFLLLSIMLLSACTTARSTPGEAAPAFRTERTPLVIAHRGASAALPEHTLAAYARAIDDGADVIEPDLVSTRDGMLVSRHENEIGGTTDVAKRPDFADRRTRKRIDGAWVEGWFTEDFTLAELKQLRARERLPDLRSTAHDGQYTVATFEEIIALAADASARTGRMIGLAPELKHPTYFASIDLAMEDRVLDALAAHPHTRNAPVFIQSFETGNLRRLRERVARDGNIRLLQLLGPRFDRPWDLVADGQSVRYGKMMTPAGLREIAGYADAVGPRWDSLDLYRDGEGRQRSRLVDDAHAVGLQVMPYTYRPENRYLPRAYRNGTAGTRNDAGSVQQMADHLEAGVDGLFTDDSALGRRAVDGR